MKCISPCILVIAACAAVVSDATAQTAPSYPTRPVRMIVPFAPGGAYVFVGRIVQPKLSDDLGEQVVIDNRAGASGNIGVELSAPALGTVLMSTSTMIVAINSQILRLTK